MARVDGSGDGSESVLTSVKNNNQSRGLRTDIKTDQNRPLTNGAQGLVENTRDSIGLTTWLARYTHSLYRKRGSPSTLRIR
jgi:hypothetical protein